MNKSKIYSTLVFFDDTKAENPTGQCDCDGGEGACSVPDLIKSHIPLDLSDKYLDYKLIRSPMSKTIFLENDFHIAYGPFHKPTLISSDVKDYLEIYNLPTSAGETNSNFQENDFHQKKEIVEKLIKSGVLAINGSTFDLADSNTTLSAWIHTTDKCNLRCEYCYLPHVKKDMTIETGISAIESIFRSAKIHKYKKIKIKYAGGESLLKFELIMVLHEHAKKLATETSIELKETILTNGTLISKDIIREIIKTNISIMISLDGIGEYHDTHRPYANGKSSFADVLRGISLVTEAKIPLDISITVSDKNIEGLPDLLTWVLENNLHFSLNFYRENDLVLDFNKISFSEDKIIKGMLAAYTIIKQILPRNNLLASLVDRANLESPHLRTCGVGQNYLVFDYQGNVSKCQMLIGHPTTTSNSDDALAEIRNDKKGILNLPVSQKEGCNSCEWQYWCAGGCSLLTHRMTSRYDVKSPNCNIYKTLYPEAVKLEGFRLLREAKEAGLVYA